jgi:NAD(P)-dependent dehydrogenase (short-subunit alcohol dehydrogenase family)
MSRALEGKIAVITGASSGIGLAISQSYLAAGARIAVFARDQDGLDKIREAAPDDVLVVAGDVTRATDLHRLVEETRTRFGNVDIVVPNAGMAKVVSFADSTEEAIHEQFSVNFVGAVQTARLFLPHINQGGAILFNTSFLTRVGFPARYTSSRRGADQRPPDARDIRKSRGYCRDGRLSRLRRGPQHLWPGDCDRRRLHDRLKRGGGGAS